MAHINIKETIRWASKKKVTTALIIGGMSIALTIALLIGLWSLNEFSFDKFHPNADRIYRICRQVNMNNESFTVGSDFGTIGTEAKEEFPQIEEMCRVVFMERQAVKISGNNAYQDHIASVDQNFFRFFSFKLENGNPEDCLDAPDKIVIDRETANKYFQGNPP